MTPAEIIGIVSAAGTLIGIVVGYLITIDKFMDGQRCLLRSEMLRIYYHNKDRGEIRQYEYENFVLLYEAYKKLKGNSFIDKIYKEVQKWKVLS